MRIEEIDPALAAEIAEDRWSEVKARKPVAPKKTALVRELDAKKRKLARQQQKPSP